MPITLLPGAPSRDRPATFATEANDLLGALPNLVVEINDTMVTLDETVAAALLAVSNARESSLAAVTAARDSAVGAVNGAGATALNAVNAVLTSITPMVAAVQTAHEAAVNLPSTGGTSSSSLSLTIGSKVIATQTGKNWRAGQYINCAYTVNAAGFWMAGTVQSYDPDAGTLVVMIDDVIGTGTFTNWTLSLGARSKLLPTRVFISSDTTAVDGVEYIFEGPCSLTLPADGTVYFNNLSNSRDCYIRRPSGGKIEGVEDDIRLDLLRAGGAIAKINNTKGWCLQ